MAVNVPTLSWRVNEYIADESRSRPRITVGHTTIEAPGTGCTVVLRAPSRAARGRLPARPGDRLA